MSPERQQRVHVQALTGLREMELREFRQLAGMSQAAVAEQADFDQGELSRIERGDDLLLSTLRRYVEALGGELEVVPVLGNHRFRLRSW